MLPKTYQNQIATPISRTLSMREMYKQSNRKIQNGIEGYELVKKYEDPAAIMKSKQSSGYKKKIYEIKRGSYLDDQIRYRKQMPGPGLYELRQNISKSEIKTRRKTEPQRMTYVDEIVRASKKQKMPPPGQYYDGTKTMGAKSIHSFKQVAFGQRAKSLKTTYLDNAEYEGVVTPGAGYYNIPSTFRTKSEQSLKLSQKPQYWREYHKQLITSAEKKLKKSGPTIGSYDPKPLAYELFQQKKKVSRVESQHKLSLRKSQRFKTDDVKKSGMGPGKYNVLNEWAPKGKGKKGILSTISKLPSPSVYYH